MPIRLQCPLCGSEVEVPDDVLPGEIVEHEECGAQLEVYKDSNGNFALRLAENVGEDWGE